MRQHFVAKAMIGGLLGTLLQTIAVYVITRNDWRCYARGYPAGALLYSGYARPPP